MINYPKVLLFGHTFTDTTGIGITLTNLFADWPQQKIAVMANNIDVNLCEKIRPSALYIGQQKIKVKVDYQKKNKITLSTKLKQVIKYHYRKAGIRELTYKPSISEEDLRLAQVFNPDIIFCCLGSLNSIRLCEYLMDRMPNAKLVLYIVDDWVNTKINSRYFTVYWKRKYDREFRKLLNRASGCLSICQHMSDVYKEKYNREFFPFHNPVDIEEWSSLKIERKYSENISSILYVGKINEDTRQCLLDMGKVIENLNEEGYRFIFDVYSPDYGSNQYIFNDLKYSNVFPAVSHIDIPRISKAYSALFLTLGFSKQSREYVRLSMPTKLSEYLASGVSIILYCPPEIALAKYLVDQDCVIACTENDLATLQEKVLLLRDSHHIARLVSKSRKLAEDHDIEIVRERFRKTMYNFISM